MTSLYKILSHSYSKIPLFKKLSTPLISRKLILACNYYQNYYHLQPEEIVATCIGLTFTIIILGVVFFIIFHFAIILPTIFITAIIIFTPFYYKIINEYENENRCISKYADHITQDFLFALQSSNSLFNALKYVANVDYPVISNKFKELIYRVHLGDNPQQLLEEFLYMQPSETLRNNLISIIRIRNTDSSQERILGFESHRMLRAEYESSTMQVENKIMIIAATNVFLPLILGLGLVFWGYGGTPIFLMLIPIHLLLGIILKNKLLKRRDELFES